MAKTQPANRAAEEHMPNAPDRLLTEREVAERLGWTPEALQRRRWLGKPPAYVKLGSFSVRYESQVIDEFIEAGRQRASDTGEVV